MGNIIVSSFDFRQFAKDFQYYNVSEVSRVKAMIFT